MFYSNSARAITTLAAAQTINVSPFASSDDKIWAQNTIDKWLLYIGERTSNGNDISQDDLGSIYRDVASIYNDEADNLRDESHTIEVER